MRMSILKLIVVVIISSSVITDVFSQNSPSKNTLQSELLNQIKVDYETCVFEKGKTLLKHTSFEDAMTFAPLACRKTLLRTKKYLLDSAFKVDVINQLVDSIEEGVQIDLTNVLIEELKKE